MLSVTRIDTNHNQALAWNTRYHGRFMTFYVRECETDLNGGPEVYLCMHALFV